MVPGKHWRLLNHKVDGVLFVVVGRWFVVLFVVAAIGVGILLLQ